GDYFKAGAIEYATEFVRDRLELDWDRIWVSVHAGDPELQLGPDQEAIDLWERIGVPPERIVPLPSSENFWSVGGPGPCGPDSEIYYDWGPETGCKEGCLPGCARCERFLEFWNLVFMAFELHPDRTLAPLPKQNIDTGMGLERMARIVQNVPSVYDTDGYQAIMGWIAEASGVAYGDSVDATKAHRVLADHGRGMTFLAGEGITPSNEGRGYVLRRIVRRAIQHGLRIGMEAPFIADLSGVVIAQMGGAYPELSEHRDQIARILQAEEERFSETLERGMKLFEDAAAAGAISGADAFTLQATYGFPIELTVELARERGIPVDEETYAREMDAHREISRAGGGKGEAQRAADFARAAGFTTEFVGWERTQVLTQIGALEELGDGLFLAKLRESPFYAEGGGQVTDAGELVKDDGSRATLVAAYRIDDDQALLFEGEGFAAGDRVEAVVPWSVRFPTMANHTATHLLHEALRAVLGDHVRQAGSAVRPDKLRFDFTHPRALTAEERAEVERRVNEAVFANHPVRTYIVPIAEARGLGAMMLFGEKYGDEVRVVDIEDVSRELCGGTHVRTTAEIGPFVILSEGSVGSGARRIEAVTAGEAYALLRARAGEADELRAELGRVRKEAKRPARQADADFEITSREGDVLVVEARGVTGGDLRDLTDRIRQQEGATAVLAGSTDDGRAFLVFNLDQALADRGIDAVALVRDAARHIQGGGGGRPTLAEAGGKKPEALADALGAAKDALLAQL
ncbi:MAG TPA: alanine--tRNA ligase, partial [Gaiellaceae bacterium]|nr:alanine--tRNA ligase [Gaiellaceae bacterium]